LNVQVRTKPTSTPTRAIREATKALSDEIGSIEAQFRVCRTIIHARSRFIFIEF
jgi:hypothetical protein